MSSKLILPEFLSKLTKSRFASFAVGAAAICFSTISIWFALSLKEFSSNLRDNFEPQPGFFEIFVFGAFIAGLVFILILGVYLLFKSFWHRGNVA